MVIFNKPESKSALQSYFSMGQYIFEQLDAILKQLINVMPLVRCRNPESIRLAWSYLKEFYIKIHMGFLTETQEKFEEELKKIDEAIIKYEQAKSKYKQHVLLPSQELCSQIDNFYMELVTGQQLLGLGLEFEKKESLLHKGKRIMLGG
jgi:hypothetical protein